MNVKNNSTPSSVGKVHNLPVSEAGMAESLEKACSDDVCFSETSLVPAPVGCCKKSEGCDQGQKQVSSSAESDFISGELETRKDAMTPTTAGKCSLSVISEVTSCARNDNQSQISTEKAGTHLVPEQNIKHHRLVETRVSESSRTTKHQPCIVGVSCGNSQTLPSDTTATARNGAKTPFITSSPFATPNIGLNEMNLVNKLSNQVSEKMVAVSDVAEGKMPDHSFSITPPTTGATSYSVAMEKDKSPLQMGTLSAGAKLTDIASHVKALSCDTFKAYHDNLKVISTSVAAQSSRTGQGANVRKSTSVLGDAKVNPTAQQKVPANTKQTGNAYICSPTTNDKSECGVPYTLHHCSEHKISTAGGTRSFHTDQQCARLIRRGRETNAIINWSDNVIVALPSSKPNSLSTHSCQSSSKTSDCNVATPSASTTCTTSSTPTDVNGRIDGINQREDPKNRSTETTADKRSKGRRTVRNSRETAPSNDGENVETTDSRRRPLSQSARHGVKSGTSETSESSTTSHSGLGSDRRNASRSTTDNCCIPSVKGSLNAETARAREAQPAVVAHHSNNTYAEVNRKLKNAWRTRATQPNAAYNQTTATIRHQNKTSNTWDRRAEKKIQTRRAAPGQFLLIDKAPSFGQRLNVSYRPAEHDESSGWDICNQRGRPISARDIERVIDSRFLWAVTSPKPMFAYKGYTLSESGEMLQVANGDPSWLLPMWILEDEDIVRRFSLEAQTVSAEAVYQSLMNDVCSAEVKTDGHYSFKTGVHENADLKDTSTDQNKRLIEALDEADDLEVEEAFLKLFGNYLANNALKVEGTSQEMAASLEDESAPRSNTTTEKHESSFEVKDSPDKQVRSGTESTIANESESLQRDSEVSVPSRDKIQAAVDDVHVRSPSENTRQSPIKSQQPSDSGTLVVASSNPSMLRNRVEANHTPSSENLSPERRESKEVTTSNTLNNDCCQSPSKKQKVDSCPTFTHNSTSDRSKTRTTAAKSALTFTRTEPYNTRRKSLLDRLASTTSPSDAVEPNQFSESPGTSHLHNSSVLENPLAQEKPSKASREESRRRKKDSPVCYCYSRHCSQCYIR
ncbi:general transcriptional corepressor trfA-like [Ptychodera flava]|uniref:general transcriptional corepressor trfA-like n=1 Tax=Ptychodera flava TaxID=63121 RepID=UPI00396AA8E2